VTHAGHQTMLIWKTFRPSQGEWRE